MDEPWPSYICNPMIYGLYFCGPTCCAASSEPCRFYQRARPADKYQCLQESSHYRHHSKGYIQSPIYIYIYRVYNLLELRVRSTNLYIDAISGAYQTPGHPLFALARPHSGCLRSNDAKTIGLLENARALDVSRADEDLLLSVDDEAVLPFRMLRIRTDTRQHVLLILAVVHNFPHPSWLTQNHHIPS